MHKISLKGVVIGWITYLVASTILTLVAAIGLSDVLRGLLDGHHTEAANHTSYLFVISLPFWSYLSAILAGYTSAYIAKQSKILNGTLASIPAVFMAAIPLFYGSVSTFLQLRAVIDIPVFLALAAFGGYLCQIRVRNA